MIRTDLWLPDPASLLQTGAFGPGALTRLERSDNDGTTWTEATTTVIVGTQAQYTYWDPAGDADSIFRYRVSKAAPAVPGDYSPYSQTFHGTSPADAVSAAAYATLGDLLGVFTTAISGAASGDARKLGRLNSLLVTVTDELIRECGGRDYFRHPATGTEAWLQDGNGTDTIHVHEGIVSLTKLEISFDQGQSFLEVDPSFYELRGSDPAKVGPIPAGEPFFHVRLLPYGPYPLYLRGKSTVRMTGVHGWSTIPTALREGNVQRARQIAYNDPSYGGNIPGPDEMGVGGAPERWPQITYHFLQAQTHRFIACQL